MQGRTVRAGLAIVLLAGIAVPAPGQDTPESLLPPGFDDPAPAPAPAPAATRAPQQPLAPGEPGEPVGVVPDAGLDLSNLDFGNASEAVEPEVAVDLTQYELPEFARHSLARIGVFAAGNEAFPATGFGAADGRYLRALMQRTAAPIASRWASIALRRALMSPANTPRNIDGADFAAERAWLLLRMGEAMAARAVVNDVDTDNYTTRMFQVAMQSALASGDPAGMCPMASGGGQAIHQRGWALAKAMCAGLAGKPNEAGQLITQARQGTSASDIDNLLSEKVLGAGAQGRRAVTIEWNGVTQLTAWRWGLATATGVEVPASLYATAGPQVRYWQALAPNIDPAARVAAAELAATAGVFSNAGLVDLYSEIEQEGDTGSAAAAVARDLRIAYTDSDVADRMKAMQTLWDAAETPRTRYARLILTARAASWVPANAKIEAPEQLIASMLSAGLEGPAMEWRTSVKRGSEGWALLALADPAPDARASYGDFTTYRDAAGPRKAQLLLAGLAGLGRFDAAEAQRGAQAVDVQIGGTNSWTRAIDAAGQRGDASLVALLAGVGMQSRSWDYVSPEALFHIVAAMRAAGMGSYARMIAVEAITRA
ncbi:hypothetical protein [Sphingomonas hengshuiensis]|uniref:hypothetical protein n=1 Tax=Sphingomonas hengshuiensis TaxID=1609977 RepID=UPI0005C9C436|nr:hypothetical protein [Sphingomonas hengshuiensis]